LIALSLLSAIATPAAAGPPQFWEDDPEARALAVNEGPLHLLDRLSERPVHHHRNLITIERDSLSTGWVRLEQCHEQLDPVGTIEIVYHPERIRKLRLLDHSGIGEVRVIDHRVELHDVGPNSRLCLSAESRAMHGLDDGRYELRNGPYMRRFLDGYYPMRVSMTIHHPPELRLLDHDPAAQPGFAVTHQPGQVAVSARFEGKLYTRFRFCTQPCSPSPKSTDAEP
jgi:hypothetical protein